MRGTHLVREARRRAGFTQAQLAGRAGTTQSAIARIEGGSVAPTLKRLTELVRACGFDIDVRLVPRDDHDLSMALRNRALEPAERVSRMLDARRFGESARKALEAAKRAR